jgi:Oxidoreductase family, NAD-binding Rossmann fold
LELSYRRTREEAMPTSDHVTRRDFVTAAGGAALLALAPSPLKAAAGARRRYAIVGTGVRGVGMWGKPLVTKYGDVLEFVGLCDINPLRVEVGKKAIGVSCPTFTSLDEMLDKAKPEMLMVTTVDATHVDCIVKALDKGIDVLTEKPMAIDEKQIQTLLDAEKRWTSPGTWTPSTGPTTSAAGTGCARRAARSGSTRPPTTSTS